MAKLILQEDASQSAQREAGLQTTLFWTFCFLKDLHFFT